MASSHYGSGGALSGQGAQTALAAQAKYSSKAQEYIEKLTTADALTAVKIGQEIHQAKRLLTKFEESGSNACEAVALRSHINVLSLCVALDVNKIGNLKAAEGQKKMEQLCPQLRSFPLPWQAAVVAAKLRDACPSNADEIEEWVNTITPFLPCPLLSCGFEERV